MAAYYDIQGKSINQTAYENLVEALKVSWEEVKKSIADMNKQDEPGYLHYTEANVVRQFTNGKIRVTLSWNGLVDDKTEKNYFPSDYQLFKLTISNFMPKTQSWLDEPSGKTYYNRNKANLEFEDILLSYAKCYYDEEGEFVMEGNLFHSHMPTDMEALKVAKAKALSTPKTVLTDGMVW